MWELEAQEMGGFVDVVTVHQEVLALFNHEGMDVTEVHLPAWSFRVTSSRRLSTSRIHLLNEILFILKNKTYFVLICNFSYDTTGITCCQYS